MKGLCLDKKLPKARMECEGRKKKIQVEKKISSEIPQRSVLRHEEFNISINEMKKRVNNVITD